jgi:hypothetical protein
LAVVLRILEYFFQILQNFSIFYIFFLKINQLLHVYYAKFIEIFSLFKNFDFFQKFPVEYQIFLHILIVPIIYECGKVKKVLGNKTGITSYP